MIAVILGLPASGKSTVGKALALRYGWHFYDMDDTLPPAVKEMNKAGQLAPQEMIDEYVLKLFDDVAELERTGSLVVSCTLVRPGYVERFSERFPSAIFMYLEAPLDVLITRAKEREHFFRAELVEKLYESGLHIAPFGHVIDAHQPLEAVLAACDGIIRSSGLAKDVI